MKKYTKKISKLLAALLLSLCLQAFAVTTVFALECGTNTVGGGSIKNPLCSISEVGSSTDLPSFTEGGVHPDAVHTIQPGAATINSTVFFALDAFKLMISTIAFIVVIIASIRLVAHSTDEEAGKAKTAMLYGVIGLFVVQLADPIVREMFFGEEGEAFEAGMVEEYADNTVVYIRGVIGFIQIILGAAAVMVIIMRGFTLVYSSGEEEEITKAKTHIVYAIVGLVVVGISEQVVRGFVFPEGGESLPDVQVGNQIVISITNYVAGFVSIFAFISLFYAGYRYVVSGGNEEVTEKVKKSILGAVLALLLALGAFAFVNTVLTLDDTGDSSATVVNHIV
jgi:hypothetical protein